MQVIDTIQDLLETAFDLARRHPTLLDRSVQISAWTKLHYFTPVLVLVLNEIHSLNDIDVMQG